MALAQPALRQFGFQKLQRLRFRGGSLLGTAIGSAIGIGYGLSQNYDLTVPWSRMEQPAIRRRAVSGSLQGNEVSNNVS